VAASSSKLVTIRLEELFELSETVTMTTVQVMVSTGKERE